MKSKFFVLIILQFWLICGNAQDCPIDLDKLPLYRNGFSPLNDSFEKSNECTVVLSEGFDTTQYKRTINRITSWFLNKNTRLNIQYSSNIEGFNKGEKYLLVGLMDDFKDLHLYDLPFDLKQAAISNTKILREKNDAIVTINENADCVAFIGNSYEALTNLASRWLGFYDYYILKDNKIRFFGNLRDGTFSADSLIDVKLLRDKNYTQIIENKYVIAHFSCKYDSIIKYKMNFDSLNVLFDDFCLKYELNPPNTKLNYLVHFTPLELNIVCGSPKPGSTAGFVIDGIINTVGIDIGLLIHEGIHFIFDENMPSPNAFFNEAIPASYDLFLNPDNIISNSKLVSNAFDYDISGLITGKTDFWKGPYYDGQLLSYPISGLFVKYLIDNYSIRELKELYTSSNIESGMIKVFNRNMEDIITDWKQWIINITN
ncbi:MAG: hypothetical protein WC929_04805 [Bacilli bacterium]|jgi:hypothetical protein